MYISSWECLEPVYFVKLLISMSKEDVFTEGSLSKSVVLLFLRKKKKTSLNASLVV